MVVNNFHDVIPFAFLCDVLGAPNIILILWVTEVSNDDTRMHPEVFAEYLFENFDCIHNALLLSARLTIENNGK